MRDIINSKSKKILEKKEDNILWISDIIHYYFPVDYSNFDNFRGIVIHEGLESLAKKYFDVDIEYIFVYPINNIKIIGKIDIVDHKKKIIYEIKTHKKIYESDLFQAFLYHYFLYKLTNISYKVRLILVSSQSREVDISEVVYTKRNIFLKMLYDYVHQFKLMREIQR